MSDEVFDEASRLALEVRKAGRVLSELYRSGLPVPTNILNEALARLEAAKQAEDDYWRTR